MLKSNRNKKNLVFFVSFTRMSFLHRKKLLVPRLHHPSFCSACHLRAAVARREQSYGLRLRVVRVVRLQQFVPVPGRQEASEVGMREERALVDRSRVRHTTASSSAAQKRNVATVTLSERKRNCCQI